MAKISQNFSKKERAALLLAEDELTDEAIAESVGITRRTLQNWKAQPEFAATVGGYVGSIQAGMLKLTIVKKHKRVARLDEMEQRLWQIVEERASDYISKAVEAAESSDADTALREIFGKEQTIPAGGSTGFVTRTLKQIGAGRSAQLLEEFGVGTDIVKTIMALHEQAAKELGQWVDRSEVSGTQTTTVQIIGPEPVPSDVPPPFDLSESN